ncbi:MAG: TolC family protein [Planctomycetia bacterium]|nr:MAG: TolC family protein [Planctomycetia bacterium]
MTRRRICLFLLTLPAALSACRSDTFEGGPSMVAYRERMIAEAQRPAAGAETKRAEAREWRHPAQPRIRPAQDEAGKPREALPTTMPADRPPAEAILAEIPDPVDSEPAFAERAEEIRRSTREQRVHVVYDRVLARANEYLAMVARPARRELSLAECIQRTLQNNYAIRAESYNPAISETRMVQAEAAFDAAFFLDAGHNNLDRPYPPIAATNQSDGWSVEAGVRKLLPTGMTASASARQGRNYVDGIDGDTTPFNPSYATTFIAQLRQPLLRGFGLDYNRRNITLARIGRDASMRQFESRLRDSLLDAERAYWRLAQARRTVTILSESVAQNWVTYQDFESLQRYKATPVQLNNARARYEQRYVTLLEAIKNVRDAEDRLKNLMNDAEFPLSRDVEIVPTEPLFTLPVVLDHFGEVRQALDRRSEIAQARLGIERSRVETAAAKNETLPQLDLSFDYQVEGLEDDSGNSFDNATMNRFRSYTVGVQFSQPFGNRAARARLRESQLRESQSIVELQRVTDSVVEEVNVAIRTLGLRYSQIPPQLASAQAAALNLRALQTRAETVDPAYLETELNAVEQLANARQNLLSVITDYTITLVELERAKGTLLDYNNVSIADAPPR